jgi:hypothetical protein
VVGSTVRSRWNVDRQCSAAVHQHVIAWRPALAGVGIDLSAGRIHRRIGGSGGLFVSALLRETGVSPTADSDPAL